MIFGIGVGQNVDRPVLTTLAAASGGEAYFPEDVTQLERGVSPHRREPAPPLDHRLHVDQRGAQRRLAAGDHSDEGRQGGGPQPRRIFRSGEIDDGCIRKPREGWMTFMPVTVLVFIVMYIVGGPGEFVNLVAQWTERMSCKSVGNWVKHL